MKLLTTILLSMIFIPSVVFSHGVHDAGGAQPKKGGVLKSLETIHLEFVQIKNETKIYIFDKDKKMSPKQVKDYEASAKVVLPRKKGTHKVALNDKGDHWSAIYDGKNVHRYDFQLNIKQGGHQDKVVFTIEPK